MPKASPVAPAPAETRTRVRVADLREGDSLDDVYMLASADARAKKNGDPFFSLSLRDASGTVQGVMWDNHAALVAGDIRADDFVHVEGGCAAYNGALQVTVRRLRRMKDEDVDPAEFLPVSPIPRPQMEAELDELIASVRQPDCRRLLHRLFGHARFRDLYCTAPAAARIHQAYLHGLLEHTLAVVRNALALADAYGGADKDLLITAGLLHDVGKIREYDWRRSIGYTDEGRLLGHISIGASMVDAAIRELARQPEGFSAHYHLQILHIILSHHGKLEYGSPTVPKTREAFLLHYADYNDAYIASLNDALAEGQAKGQRWTPYNRMFGAYLQVPRLPGESFPDGNPGALPFSDDLDPREAANSPIGNPDDNLG